MPTDTEAVRLLTGLTATDLDDQKILDLLELAGGVVKLAAADALEVVAGQLTSITSDDISIDGSKRATVLLRRATALRDQVATADADDGFFFDVVDTGSARPELTERATW